MGHRLLSANTLCPSGGHHRMISTVYIYRMHFTFSHDECNFVLAHIGPMFSKLGPVFCQPLFNAFAIAKDNLAIAKSSYKPTCLVSVHFPGTIAWC